MNAAALAKDLLGVFQKHNVTPENFANAKNIIQQILTFVENLFLTGSATLKIDEKETVNVFGSNYALDESLTVTGQKQ